MQGKRDGEIIRLLGAFGNGQPEAEARLMQLTYRELLKIAAGHMRRERSARSLQTTDLVHEAYLRLVDQATSWRDRRRYAGKRSGGVPQVSLDNADAQSGDLLVLEEALARLEKVDGRQCQVVEMRFFAGMSEDEIAEVLGVSARTVNREWRMARAWLYKEVYG